MHVKTCFLLRWTKERNFKPCGSSPPPPPHFPDSPPTTALDFTSILNGYAPTPHFLYYLFIYLFFNHSTRVAYCTHAARGTISKTPLLCDRPAVTPVSVQVHVIVLVMRPMAKQTSHVWRRLYIYYKYSSFKEPVLFSV